MGWNIAVLSTDGSKEQIEEIIPDIFYKSKENLFFEDATSSSVYKGLTAGWKDGKIIIIDVLGRFINDDRFPVQISKANKECKVFYISENVVFRHYKDGVKTRNVEGKEAVDKELHSSGIKPIDEWGETMAFQLADYEIFGVKDSKIGNSMLSNIKYDLYEVD